MADEIRTRAELLASLADNSSGNITPQDMRDLLISLHGVYGIISVKGGVTAQTGIDGTPAKMTGFTTDGLGVGITVSAATGTITILTAGDYEIEYQVSFIGSASKDFQFDIGVNGAASIYGSDRGFAAGVTPGSHSCKGVLTLAAAAAITVLVSSDDGGTSITPSRAQLYVKKVG